MTRLCRALLAGVIGAEVAVAFRLWVEFAMWLWDLFWRARG